MGTSLLLLDLMDIYPVILQHSTNWWSYETSNEIWQDDYEQWILEQVVM